MTNRKEIERLLLKAAANEDLRLFAYSVFYEDVGPGDSPDKMYKDISPQEEFACRVGSRLGLFEFKSESWEKYCDPFIPDDPVPDGRDYYYSLTMSGMDRALELRSPWWVNARNQLVRNSLTILVSIVGAVATAYVLQIMGLSPAELNSVDLPTK